MQYLLDTNILLAWIRWGTLLQVYLKSSYQLDTIPTIPVISIVSAAELRVIALQNAWGPPKVRMVENLLTYLISIPIPYKTIVDAYVEIDDFSRRSGVKMGKNDLWIAAAAQTENAVILTTDKDFNHLPQSLVQHIYIDPASHL
ncbi:MAG: type II toxin-antitoxin system VapC family toxin [Janthinobacterium lividum]